MIVQFSSFFKIHLQQEIQSKTKVLKTNVRYVDMRIKEHVEKKVLNANIAISDARTSTHVQT
jgi:hypothetical protein